MDEFYWIAVAVVTVVSASRITRFLTADKFPPMKAIRDWWGEKFDGTGWDILFYCGYCFAIWVTPGIVAWGYLTDWNTGWWLVNGTLAAAYLAGILMAYDGDEEEN